MKKLLIAVLFVVFLPGICNSSRSICDFNGPIDSVTPTHIKVLGKTFRVSPKVIVKRQRFINDRYVVTNLNYSSIYPGKTVTLFLDGAIVVEILLEERY